MAGRAGASARLLSLPLPDRPSFSSRWSPHLPCRSVGALPFDSDEAQPVAVVPVTTATGGDRSSPRPSESEHCARGGGPISVKEDPAGVHVRGCGRTNDLRVSRACRKHGPDLPSVNVDGHDEHAVFQTFRHQGRFEESRVDTGRVQEILARRHSLGGGMQFCSQECSAPVPFHHGTAPYTPAQGVTRPATRLNRRCDVFVSRRVRSLRVRLIRGPCVAPVFAWVRLDG